MKLIFHGGAKEVGRSCIELQTGKDNFFLDAGIKFTDEGFDYPADLFDRDVPKIDGLFLSHAHLDHTGALPMLEHYNLHCPILCTPQTKVLTRILLRDSYKVARIRHLHPAYDRDDIRETWKDTRFVKFKKEYKLKNLKFKFFNAGHIPGSSSIKINVEGKNLLYTGDLRIPGSDLMVPADTDYGDVDIMIIESTYGYRELPSRKELKEKFLKKVEQVIKRGGTVLIPVFAVGRAQDILIMLSEKEWKVPIIFDGMAKRVTRRITINPSTYIHNKDKLTHMYKDVVTSVSSPKRRNDALKHQSIIVTTSGMVQGGPVMHYLKTLWHEKKNAVLLTGYQAKRTNGRHLYEDHYIYIDGWKTEVKAEMEKFDFSGHSDMKELQDLITKTKPKHLIVQHGDPESVENLIKWVKKNHKNIKTYGPRVGDELEF